MPEPGRLPDFLVIGAMKAGTTSLELYLDQHPQVFMSRLKEPNYFAFKEQALSFTDAFGRPSRLNERSITDTGRYRSLFDGARPEQKAGEISHWYLYDPMAPAHIRHDIPDARLIAVLRDPVERAYSEFLFHMRDGRESVEDFGEALDIEEERLAAGCDDGRYVDRGLYHAQLSRFYDLFPSEQIRVYLFEDLRDDPATLIRDLYSFIGVDPDVKPDTTVSRNVSGIPKNMGVQRLLRAVVWQEGLREAVRRTPLGRPLQKLYAEASRRNLSRPPLAPEHRERLRATFKDDVTKLQGLIDRDLSKWLA